MNVQCPTCNHTFAVDPIPKEITCPRCSSKLEVPDPECLISDTQDKNKPLPVTVAPQPPLKHFAILLIIIASLLAYDIYLKSTTIVVDKKERAKLAAVIERIEKNTYPAASKWQYFTTTMDEYDRTDHKSLYEQLNAWGERGYELVNVIRDVEYKDRYRVFLKQREKLSP